ncbi:hypothetical protein [Leptospira noguchii]|uniref:hypothetical protein n=1 Tax=Leptospira noguchii TaxID=28182 RepID=UPI000774A331|nr:hypothetical protein [Leptospira noguchii]
MAGNEKSSTSIPSGNAQSCLEKFISETSELSRYSMAQTFRAFCALNFRKFNELKNEYDVKQAYDLFFHGQEPKGDIRNTATEEIKGGAK